MEKSKEAPADEAPKSPKAAGDLPEGGEDLELRKTRSATKKDVVEAQ